mgnify:CR=1 FL=1
MQLNQPYLGIGKSYFINPSPPEFLFLQNINHISATGLGTLFAGLTVSDIDLENGIINVDHQLLKGRNGKYTISTPKTEYGTITMPHDLL